MRGVDFTVVGGGLGGGLMALYLAKAGHSVEMFEKRSDSEIGSYCSPSVPAG